LQHFVELRSLHLENNRLTDFAALGSLRCLEQLYLSCNRIACLPTLSDNAFAHLRCLDVSFNFLSANEVFGQRCDLAQLPSLRELDASGNEMSRLPEVLGSFPALQSLSLESNKLSEACLRSLAGLPRLTLLGLAHNCIKSLPERLLNGPAAFAKLETLDISHNAIRCAPLILSCPATHVQSSQSVWMQRCKRTFLCFATFENAAPSHCPCTACNVSVGQSCLRSMTTTMHRVTLRARPTVASFISCRSPDALRGLSSFRNGTNVYVGGNPIANKMKLHLLSPGSVPGCKPGTVSTSVGRLPHNTIVHTPGKGAARPSGQLSKSLDAGAGVRDSVVLNMDHALPERPTLAKSMTSLHRVSDQLDTSAPQKLTFEGLDHAKLIQVFDHLKDEIDNWHELATVHEEDMEQAGAAAELGRTFITDVAVPDAVRPTPGPPRCAALHRCIPRLTTSSAVRMLWHAFTN
jgi:Leucine rich repeat/Leucine Rich repeats (2 copies)